MKEIRKTSQFKNDKEFVETLFINQTRSNLFLGSS